MYAPVPTCKLQAPLLQELEIPWVIRKAMVKYGSQSADVIRHAGGSLRVTTVNAKASWTRDSVDGRTLTQVRGTSSCRTSQGVVPCSTACKCSTSA